MPSKRLKTSRGTEKTDNRQRRRESCKAPEQMHKSSTDVLPPNATTTASAERSGVATCDPGNALKADATQKVTDDCPEAGTASTAVENRAGNVVELWSTDVRLARPQSSTETDFPRVEPSPSQPAPTTITDLASASPRVRNGNAAGRRLNAKDSGDQGQHTTDSRSRERLIVHGTATTTAVNETVSPPKEGCHEGNAPKSQEGAALSLQSTVSPLSTLSPDTRTTATAEGTYASPDVLGSVMTSSVSPVSDGSLDKASGPLPAPSTATGQAAGAQEGNPEGGTVTEGPPVRRTGPMAAATSIGVRATGLEADLKGLKMAQPTTQTANTTRRQRPRASLAVSPELEESFYKRMAVITRSPQPAKAKSSMIGGWAAVGLASLCGTFIALILFCAVILQRQKNYTDDKICDTHDCFVHASLLKASLNLSVDPCHDFSAFVCSSWAPKQTQFREKVTTVMDNLRYSWYRYFGQALRLASLKLPVGKKPLAMYEMCLAGSTSTNDAPLMYKFVRNQLTKWNIFNEDISAVSLALLLAYKWQAPLWLAVTLLDGRRSSSGRWRVAVRPGAYLPIILTQHRVVAGAYIQYMKSFLAAYLPDDAALAWTDDEINAIRAMEGDVIGQLSSVRDEKKPALLTFAEFDAMIPNKGGLIHNFQNALFLQPQLTPRDEVILSDVRFFEILAGLVATYGDGKLKFLLTWQFMQLYSPLGDLSLLTIRYGTKSRAETYRPAFCAHHVEASFKVLVLSLAVAASFTDEQRDHIDALFDGLVSAAVRKVNSSTWLDEESKVRLAHKLALVTKWMWPPQSLLAEDALEKIYADVSENETSIVEFWMKTRRIMDKVNETTDYNDASRLLGNNFPLYIDYDYVFNSVNVATGVAAAPAYYRNGTAAMFYGGLGFLMAMQLVRSIDEEGLQWKAAESIVDSILSHSSRSAYEEKVRCLNESGSRSVFPEIPALEIAISAFEETTLAGEGEHLALSPDLPEGKVFFLTICYMTCAAPGHSSPMAADCNKLAQNSQYFARVYGCPKGSRMNPVKKCSFFG